MIWCLTLVVNTTGFIVLTEPGGNFYLHFGTAQSVNCIMKFMDEDSHNLHLVNLFLRSNKQVLIAFSCIFQESCLSTGVSPVFPWFPCTGKPQTRHSAPDVVSPVTNRGDNHSSQPAGCTPANPARCVVGKRLGTVSTRTPSSWSQSCLPAVQHLVCTAAQLCTCLCGTSWGCGQPIYPLLVSCTLLNNPVPALPSHSPLSASFHLVSFIPSSWSLIKTLNNTCTVWASALPNPLQPVILPSRWLNELRS